MAFIAKKYRPPLRLLEKHGSASVHHAGEWEFALPPEVYRENGSNVIACTDAAAATNYDWMRVLGCWSWTIKPPLEYRASSRISELYAKRIEEDGTWQQVSFPAAQNHYYAVPYTSDPASYYRKVGNSLADPAEVADFMNSSYWASAENWATSGGNGLMPMTWELPMGDWCNYIRRIRSASAGLRITIECLMGALKENDDIDTAFITLLKNESKQKNGLYHLYSDELNTGTSKIFKPGREYVGRWSALNYRCAHIFCDPEYFDDSQGDFFRIYITPMLDSCPTSHMQPKYLCGPVSFKITVIGVDIN